MELNGKVGGPISQNFAEWANSFETISLLTKVGIPKVAQKRDRLEGLRVLRLIRISEVARNEDVFEGFGVFEATLGIQMSQRAEACCIENI